MIKLIVADDHKIFRDGIVSIMNTIEDITVIGEAKDGRKVMDLLETILPDVILMDISMGDAGGLMTTKLVKEKYPAIKILVLSMHAESTYIVKMLEAGASGYVLKDAGSRELVNAINTVIAGGTYYSNEVSLKLIQHLMQKKKIAAAKKDIPLTPREIEILKLIAEEYSNPEIAKKLYISIRTVDTHRRNLLEKLDVKNTAGLVKYAIRKGLVE